MKNVKSEYYKVQYLAIYVLLVLCTFFYGCNPECGLSDETLKLATESRLPRWGNFSGYQRQDLSMMLNCCSVPWGGRAEVIIYGPAPERKILLEKTVKMRWHPLSDKEKYNKYPSDKYPNYSIININGVDEVFERRNFGSSLYITDDPNITAYNNK